MSATPQFIAAVKTPTSSIANADGTAFKTIGTTGTLGTRLDALSIVNTDAASAYVVQFAVQKSGVDFELGEVTIPIGAGTNGSAKAVAVGPIDLPFLGYTESGAIFLEAGAVLRWRSKTAVAGSNSLKLVGFGGDY